MVARAPDVIVADGATVAWFAQPNQLLAQVRVAHYTVELARTFTESTMARALQLFAGRPIMWVSDSRAIRTYEPGARTVLTDWTLRHKRDVERVVIVVSPLHKLPLMGLRVASIAATMAGIKMSVFTSLAPLRELGVVWPEPEPVAPPRERAGR